MQRRDLPGRFVPGDPWRRPGQVVTTLATIDVGEVETNRVRAHHGNTGRRSRIGQGSPLQSPRSARTGKRKCVHATIFAYRREALKARCLKR